MKKLILLFTLALLISAPITVFAAILPEDDIVGETLYIEPDENTVIDNLNEDKKDDIEMTRLKEISMTESRYFLTVILPFFALILLGTTPYFAEKVIARVKTK